MLCVHAYAMIEEGVSMEHANVDEVFWSIYIIFEILPFDPWFYLGQIRLVLILYRAGAKMREYNSSWNCALAHPCVHALALFNILLTWPICHVLFIRLHKWRLFSALQNSTTANQCPEWRGMWHEKVSLQTCSGSWWRVSQRKRSDVFFGRDYGKERELYLTIRIRIILWFGMEWILSLPNSLVLYVKSTIHNHREHSQITTCKTNMTPLKSPNLFFCSEI